jgi:hypothetical protein
MRGWYIHEGRWVHASFSYLIAKRLKKRKEEGRMGDGHGICIRSTGIKPPVRHVCRWWVMGIEPGGQLGQGGQG